MGMIDRIVESSLRNRLFVLARRHPHHRLGRLVFPPHPHRRLSRRDQHPSRGPLHRAGPFAARSGKIRHLSHRDVPARPAPVDRPPLGLQVRTVGHDDRLRGRRGHLFRPPAGPGAADRGQGQSPAGASRSPWARSPRPWARSTSTRSRERCPPTKRRRSST